MRNTSPSIAAAPAGASASSALDQDERRLQALDAADVGTWRWDLQTNTIQWDDRCRRMFGAANVSGVMFEQFFAIIHPDDRLATRNAVLDAVQNRREYDMIHRVVWPDGSIHWLRCKGKVDSPQQPSCLRGISIEATWLKRMEDVLRLNERLTAAADLASMLAHEINNPLEIMCNALYLLSASASAEAQEYAVDCIRGAYGRIEYITRQMLRVEAPHDLVSVNLSDSLEDVAKEHQSELQARRINLRSRCAKDEHFYCSSPDIRRILSILVVNAIDAIGQDGTIAVHVSCRHDWSPERRPGVRITVADSGRGIAPELARNIFEPFTSSKERRGAGLGLWICRTLANRYAGSIRFRSTTAQHRSGSCFSVFLRESKPLSAYSPTRERVQRLFPAAG